MITRNIARRAIATVGSLGMLAGIGLTATAASAATSHHGDRGDGRHFCENVVSPGTITYLKADGYQITTSSDNTWQYQTDRYMDRVAASDAFADHAVTVLTPSVCGDDEG